MQENVSQKHRAFWTPLAVVTGDANGDTKKADSCVCWKISVIPLPNGEIDKYDLQGLGETKSSGQLCVYVTLSAN